MQSCWCRQGGMHAQRNFWVRQSCVMDKYGRWPRSSQERASHRIMIIDGSVPLLDARGQSCVLWISQLFIKTNSGRCLILSWYWWQSQRWLLNIYSLRQGTRGWGTRGCVWTLITRCGGVRSCNVHILVSVTKSEGHWTFTHLRSSDVCPLVGAGECDLVLLKNDSLNICSYKTNTHPSSPDVCPWGAELEECDIVYGKITHWTYAHIKLALTHARRMSVHWKVRDSENAILCYG